MSIKDYEYDKEKGNKSYDPFDWNGQLSILLKGGCINRVEYVEEAVDEIPKHQYS